MPKPENAEQVRIPCRRCPREHFGYIDQATRQVLAYDGSVLRCSPENPCLRLSTGY